MLICIPDVLDRADLGAVLDAVEGAAFEDGVVTAGAWARRVKNNLQMVVEGAAAEGARNLIVERLTGNAEFRSAVLPRTMRPPHISRYEAGMAYGPHVDNALMGKGDRARTDVAVTLFLSAPDAYDGGALVVEGAFGRQAVKLPAGAAVAYPASSLHQVEPVTRGVRLAAVTWVESRVRDPAKREILYDLDNIKRAMSREMPEAPETDLPYKTRENLLRMWSE